MVVETKYVLETTNVFGNLSLVKDNIVGKPACLRVLHNVRGWIS